MSNHKKSLQFRELVALLMQADGLPAVNKPPVKSLSEAMRDEPPASHILGIPGWSILTRNEVQRDLSTGMADAAKAASHDGASRYATVFRRHDAKPADESYVVTTLAVFNDVLRELTTGATK